MFGLDFLFSVALWALPLALLPLLLHLLFRRKSPILAFSTLRFVRSSLQQTAARRRVQRWLLLAARILLLALLIWAVAQPARVLRSRWFAAGARVYAAIVVDTSYSMQLSDGQIPLLDRAGSQVTDLLRGQLQGANVALLTSSEKSGAEVERFRSATAVLASWTPLLAEPAPAPLIDRVAAARQLLREQPSGQKWLFILSDFQSREFPRALPPAEDDLRIVAFDLHAPHARSAGITRLTLNPPQPIPGIRSTLTAELAGHPGDVKPVSLRITSIDGRELLVRGPQIATLSPAGQAQVRFDLELPAERWQLISASLPADAMPWDDSRTLAAESGVRQKATLLDRFTSPDTPAARFVRLALDPSEGKLHAWPLEVTQAPSLRGGESVVAAPLAEWPDAAAATRLRDTARSGGTVVLMVRPGLEAKWAALPPAARALLQELLPSAPRTESPADELYRAQASSAARAHPQFKTLLEDTSSLSTLVVRRVCPFAIDDPRTTSVLLTLTPPRIGVPPQSLLFRREVGSGVVYTWATLPDMQQTNLATHPLFMPLLVSSALRPAAAAGARNLELGERLTLDAPGLSAPLNVHASGGEVYRATAAATGSFILDRKLPVGIYTWKRAQAPEPAAVSSVQPPSAESELITREADSVLPPGEKTLVVRSLDELQQQLATLREPEPRWSLPIALALSLLCLESFLAGSSFWRRAR